MPENLHVILNQRGTLFLLINLMSNRLHNLLADGLLQPTKEKDVFTVKKASPDEDVIEKMETLAVDAQCAGDRCV